ncbi:hypothetical protein DCAR_0729788 [Daucus carota subsp. sativus]|uniref:MYB transcription factor n=1 Tax=Daucus carota subsp. sativus TaxID=79200 RepID=A0AAF0XPQ2_DAUCS|nr:hypothetical protein DCAR_0729788 [Daucus carota subsp. sativus]
MGAPKQKWTSEEEVALKAGVKKHDAGKWRTILKDPEFSGDKWRNMSVIADGWGSREKARLALKRMHQSSKDDDNFMALAHLDQSDEELFNEQPLATSMRSIIRLDNLIMEEITNLKNNTGLLQTLRLLSKLKFLTNSVRLRNYPEHEQNFDFYFYHLRRCGKLFKYIQIFEACGH